MIESLIVSIHPILSYALFFALQLAVILVLRRPVRRRLGAESAYSLWMIPLLCFAGFIVNQVWTYYSLPEISGVTDNAFLAPFQQILNDSVPAVSASAASTSFFQFGVEITFLDMVVLAWSAGILWMCWRFFINRLALTALLNDAEAVEQTSTFNSLLQESGLSTISRVVQLPSINSPMLAGVYRPVLMLPENFFDRYGRAEQRLMLAHEGVHLCRRDNLWNLFAWLLKTLFWLNPLVYLAYSCYRYDQELACDSRVLKQRDPGQRTIYANALLSCIGSGNSGLNLPQLSAWGSYKKLKERTQMIGNKASNGTARITGYVLVLLISGVLTACISAPTSGEQPANTISREVYEHIESIQLAMDEQDYEAARSGIETLKEMRGTRAFTNYESYMTYMFETQLLLDTKAFEELTFVVEEALQSPSLSERQQANFLHIRSGSYTALERYQEAISDLEYALQLDMSESSRFALESRLATLYFEQNQFEQALPHALAAIDIGKDEGKVYAQNYQLVSEIYQGLQDRAKALEYSQLASEADVYVEPGTGESGYQPIVTVPPQYPQRAQIRGIEGWVLVQFTVGLKGEVIDPVVIDSQPGDIFDESALAAVSRYRYNPRTVDGEVVETEGVQQLLRYTLP